MQVSKLIKKPLVTEKAVANAEVGKYTFEVAKDACVRGVADELKRLYKVDVVDAKVLVMPGKKRRIGKTSKFTKALKWKKMVVSLKQGQKIDLFDKS